MTKTVKLSVDLSQDKYVYFNISQYDIDSTKVIVTVTNDGKVQTINSSAKTYIKWLKADGKKIVDPCEIENGKITFIISEQMAIASGKSIMELLIAENEQIIHTMNIIVNVKEAVFPDNEVSSEDEFIALEEALIKISKDYSYVMEYAQASADAAKLSEEKAKESEIKAKESEIIISNNVSIAEEKAEEASTYATNALLSENNAKESENNAKDSENKASISETNANNSEINAKISENNALASSNIAIEKAKKALESETNAKTSEINSAASATSAEEYANSASNSANTATNKANEASDSALSASNYASTAINKADEATTYATKAESFAQGGTGTRENEDVNNAQYYYEQVKQISEGLNGALLPMGTITFAQLSNQTKQSGYMYNISDEFTTTSDFKEGSGYVYPAGTNVYYTADGKWDCLAGTMVTGIKGDSESSYRKGNVNITMSNLGYGNVENKSSATIRSEITQDNITTALGYTPTYELISDSEPSSDFWLQEYE